MQAIYLRLLSRTLQDAVLDGPLRDQAVDRHLLRLTHPAKHTFPVSAYNIEEKHMHPLTGEFITFPIAAQSHQPAVYALPIKQPTHRCARSIAC